MLGALALASAVGPLAACGFGGEATGELGLGPGVGPGLEAGSDVTAPGDGAIADSSVEVAADGSSLDVSVDTAPDVVTTPPPPGNALHFSGSNYVEIGALVIPTDFTFEAWIRRAASATERVLLAKDRSGQSQGQCRLGIDAAGHLFFMGSDSTGNDHGLYENQYALVSPAALPTGTWEHVAFTKSGGALTLYVGGVAVDKVTADMSFAISGPAVAFRIGARVASDGSSVSDGFAGDLDEVRVWNVARTASELTASMKTPILAGSAAFPSLVGSWRFDEGVGTTTADATGKLPGTLVAGPTWLASTAY